MTATTQVGSMTFTRPDDTERIVNTESMDGSPAATLNTLTLTEEQGRNDRLLSVH